MLEKQGEPNWAPVVRRVPPAAAGASSEVKSPVWPTKTGKPTIAPRTKVTAEDVEAKFTALLAERHARQERKATREPRRMGTLVRAVVASAMGVGIIGFGLGISAANTQHAADLKANQGKEAPVSGALAGVSPDSGKDTPQKLTGVLAAARKRSDELAAAQQEFAGIAYAGNAEPGTNDGRPKPAVLKSLEHRRVLAGFFAPESLLLTDAQAYSFRTEDLLGPGRIDPRQPWFSRYEPAAGGTGTARNPADPKSYTWKTASVTLSGTPGVMSVVWTNTDAGTGELLAWATARYSVDANTFRTLSVNKTTRGDSQQLKPQTAVVTPATTKGAKV
ncbi:hypothetical protein [Arthrobacter sp. ES1]|uniref:hypothetical protein n=1 Tax=Arthrobacter sp. ES1 TaxID=1897056 RepID=UPI001CFF6A7A|nr:hypothetical protein [Arthrobacter sp. ES1]MCB5280369.1 hypothetical protein [Arthrobacter sp. ES1]